jgi:hypothetical protein
MEIKAGVGLSALQNNGFGLVLGGIGFGRNWFWAELVFSNPIPQQIPQRFQFVNWFVVFKKTQFRPKPSNPPLGLFVAAYFVPSMLALRVQNNWLLMDPGPPQR